MATNISDILIVFIWPVLVKFINYETLFTFIYSLSVCNYDFAKYNGVYGNNGRVLGINYIFLYKITFYLPIP